MNPIAPIFGGGHSRIYRPGGDVYDLARRQNEFSQIMASLIG